MESSFKKPLDIEVGREMRNKRICFTFQESWAPGHRCVTGKAHYIEVFSDFEEEDEDDEPRRGHSTNNFEGDPTHQEMEMEPFLLLEELLHL